MIAKRIAALRDYMKARNIDAFIIPSTDPHQSEYVSTHWKLREYFSGFTGSAGTLVITSDLAALWTDSRYFLQFDEECKDNEVVLFKQSIPHAPEHVSWMCELLNENAIIGLDYFQISKQQVDYLLKFTQTKNIQLQNEAHFAEEIWQDRPELPNTTITKHSTDFCGETVASKLEKVQKEILNQDADFYFLSALDEIAWLFNIRSKDINFNPVVIAYALIGKTSSYIFADKRRFSQELINDLDSLSIHIEDYQDALPKFISIADNKNVVTDTASLNYAFFNAANASFLYRNSLVKALKSIKNSTEIEGMRRCMIKDGVALTKFYIWLEQYLDTGSISEYEIGRKLEDFRKQQANYIEESFSAIVGYKGNGAIIHYRAQQESAQMVENNGILLIDSGAQYLDGTTDITRTVWLGGPIPEHIQLSYTMVLKGLIALEQLQFPKGTTGSQIDSFARANLWKHGLNYPHGTGHGVGSFGMVHEPAQGFTTGCTTERGRTPHEAQQFTTIEPGCYVEGEYGIRIENIVLSKVVNETNFGVFLGYESLTLCYIDAQLINFELLTEEEKIWLTKYHRFVLEKLAPELNEDEIRWLQNKCQPYLS